ncbi:hypothetical protein BS17DRAFT_698967 [Gyrodon lividus]|nr:hypothetical protein BS17DRAFT_698967 [Gyrodon lividus]
MSTTQSLAVSMSTLPSPSSTDTSSTTEGLVHSSSLLFGFLVSVLTLFAVFMMCGIIWHRLVVRRRAIDAMLTIGVASTAQTLERPQMWDVWVVFNKQPPLWVEAKPLAAEECSPANPSKAAEAAPVMSFWRRHLLRRIPREIIYLFHRPSPPLLLQPCSAFTSDMGSPAHGSDVRVSVLISMPHPPHWSQMTEGGQKNHAGLHEIAFGTTDLLYHDSGPS